MANKAVNIVPSLIVQNTDAQVLEQDYIYNQSGFTYNQVGVDYGGVYKVSEDIIPSISLAKDIVPSLIVQRTDVQLLNQGYIYNQTNFTYNQSGISYGGIYFSGEDILPLVSKAKDITPSISGFADIYTNIPPFSGQSVGPGWFMFITH